MNKKLSKKDRIALKRYWHDVAEGKIKPPTKPNSNWSEKLVSIKGIGKETAKDLGKIYKNLDELKDAIKLGDVPVRNDVLIKLRNHYKISILKREN